MGGPDGNGTKSAEKPATPRSDKAPIGTIDLSHMLVVSAMKASTGNYAKYALGEAKITVFVRIVYDDGRAPWVQSFDYSDSNAPVVKMFPLKQIETNGVKSIEVWGEPYGYAAFWANGVDAAVGRLSAIPLQISVSGKFATILVAFEVLQSVVRFIVDEINRNKSHDTVKQCAKDNAKARELEREAEKLEAKAKDASFIDGLWLNNDASDKRKMASLYKGSARNSWARKVHTDSILMNMIFLGGGEWDHKTPIGDTWGQKNRLGDRDYAYFYDIWSNIHYGYIGSVAGFTAKELHDGASQQQRIDYGEDDENADYDSVEEGILLSKTAGNVTIEHLIGIVEKHPEWQYDIRKAKWDAAKKK